MEASRFALFPPNTTPIPFRLGLGVVSGTLRLDHSGACLDFQEGLNGVLQRASIRRTATIPLFHRLQEILQALHITEIPVGLQMAADMTRGEKGEEKKEQDKKEESRRQKRRRRRRREKGWVGLNRSE